jgi:hypothetical protein
MKVKRVFTVTVMALAVAFLFAASALALSDSEYRKMKKNSSAFAQADRELTMVLEEAEEVLSPREFNALNREQEKWLDNGRDRDAEWRIDDGLTRTEAYTAATRDRTRELFKIVEAAKKNNKPEPRHRFSIDDAEGLFECVKKGDTVYLKVVRTDDELSVEFVYGKGRTWEASGTLDDNVLEVSDDEDYMVTITYKDINTVTVKSGKLVREDFGSVLDGNFKRHYEK